jgi:hypothetical protein
MGAERPVCGARRSEAGEMLVSPLEAVTYNEEVKTRELRRKRGMSVERITIEVDIDHGRITARQPQLLPERGTGLLTVTQPQEGSSEPRRVVLPLVRCVPGTIINPTPEDLDDSLWD